MVGPVHAWHPDVPLVQEVLHASFEHAYPSHVHDSWTVLSIDAGAVVYDLERETHLAAPRTVTLLPPHIPHDGRPATDGQAYRKRVLYLEPGWLPAGVADAAATAPTLHDDAVVAAVAGVHEWIADPGDALGAECSILALRDLLLARLGTPPGSVSDVPLARRLRTLLDDRITESFTMAEAADLIGAHRGHLARAFTRAYGIAPHHYVTARRVDRARRLIGRGMTPAEAAAAAGFHDQSHLTRHFRRILGTTPGVFRAA